jgi:peptide methionine sulfoxide reductase msrA/msrB
MNKKTIRKNNKKITYFSGGCFWHIQEEFSKLNGVLSTEVGFMGGWKKKPSYKEVSTGNTGHAETVKIVYNPKIISYNKLVNYFMNIHDPTSLNKQGADIGTQYRSIAFYSSKKEKDILLSKITPTIVTEIIKKMKFYKAEKYHQNYIKKKCNDPLTENKELFNFICKNNSTKAEPKYSGKYYQKKYSSGKLKGIYSCPCCMNPLYSSKNAFISDSGWPAFSNTIDNRGLSNKSKHINYNPLTKELTCKECGLHLGHRFINKKKIHDCVNSVCLHFKKI